MEKPLNAPPRCWQPSEFSRSGWRDLSITLINPISSDARTSGVGTREWIFRYVPITQNLKPEANRRCKFVTWPGFDSWVANNVFPNDFRVKMLQERRQISNLGEAQKMIWTRFRWSVLAVVIVLTTQYGTAKQNQGNVLAPEYHKWLDEDVRWLISAQEEKDFMKLTTDDRRDHFVVEFWERRNPNPGSKENTLKEEHYRRLAFTNQHFAASVPGWKTDRGHVYVVYGPPDFVLKHSSSGTNPPEELWSYRHMPGADGDVTLKFVDRSACGEFLLVSDLPHPRR